MGESSRDHSCTDDVRGSVTTDYVREILESKHPPLIHVGYPKALSSWLQGPLFWRLNGFMRVLEPLAIKTGLIDPAPLEFDGQEVRKGLMSMRERHGPFRNTVPVISLEDLVGDRVTGGHDAKILADRLAACFGTARILMIVREQKNMLRSLYENLVIGRGYPHSVRWLLDPISPKAIPQTTPDFLRYDALAAYYRERFGPERVLILPYELFLEDPKAFVSRIAAFAGGPAARLNLDRVPTGQVVNPNRGLTAVTVLRLVNKLVLRSPLDPRGIIRSDVRGVRQWRDRTANRIARLVPDTLDRWLERRFARYVARQTAGRFRDSNRRLAEMMDTDLARYGYEI